MNRKHKIVIDVERMKYPFTGLYYYCKDLALNLHNYYAHEFDFTFFIHPKTDLPSQLKSIFRSPLDKVFLNVPKKYSLWHSTWQDTKFKPGKNVKWVLTIHDLNFLYSEKLQFKKDKLQKAIQSYIDRADAVTVISDFVKQDVLKNLDVKGKEIITIHNGVDFQAFPDFDTPTFKPKSKFLFTIGTVLYKKHFHVLPCLIENSDWELIIAGIQPDSSYLETIKKEAKKYNVSDRVQVIGSIDEMEKYWYMNNCEAFVFPSISEGFGFPPIEAMKLGKPVFLSTFTSLPEIGGEHAYYFDSFESKSMQKTLKNGLKDYHQSQKKQAIMDWGNQFTWEKAVDKYVEVYRKVLGIKPNKLSTESRKLTAIIPVLNEEVNIEAAIQSVLFADEIVLVDSYSTDKTLEIASKYPVRIIQRPFDNFSHQKNWAIGQASHPWILLVDADERVTPELEGEIKETLAQDPEENAFWIYRKNYFMGKLMHHSGLNTDKVVRLFKRDDCKYAIKNVHEEIDVRHLKMGKLSNKMIHNTYSTLNAYIEKKNRYASLSAKDHFDDNHFYIYSLFLKPIWRFIKHYFIQLGFFDGIPGLVYAYIESFGVFSRYIKIWILKNQKTK